MVCLGPVLTPDFISKVADDSNELCIAKKKTKISIDNVKESLKNFGLEKYMERITSDHKSFMDEKKVGCGDWPAEEGEEAEEDDGGGT